MHKAKWTALGASGGGGWRGGGASLLWRIGGRRAEAIENCDKMFTGSHDLFIVCIAICRAVGVVCGGGPKTIYSTSFIDYILSV